MTITHRDLNESGGTNNIAILQLAPDLSKFTGIQKNIFNFLGSKKAVIPLLWIECQLPESFKANKEALFHFDVGEKNTSRLINFEMDSRGNNIPIGIDLNQITDVDEILDKSVPSKSYNVCYTIFSKDANNKTHEAGKGELEIVVHPKKCSTPKLASEKIAFDSLEKSEDVIEHKLTNSMGRLYCLEFAHPSEISFSNPAECTLHLRIEDEDGHILKEGFYFEDKSQKSDEPHLLIPKNEVKSIYISVDFSIYKNPPTTRRIKIFVNWSYRDLSGSLKNEQIFQKILLIRPDSKRTQFNLKVIYDDKNLLGQDIHNNPEQTVRIKIPQKWAIDSNLILQLLNIDLINEAQNPEPAGQVDIKNFSIDFQLQDQAGKWQDHNQCLAKYDFPGELFNLPNGERPRSISLQLPARKIPLEIADETPGKVILTFSFREKQEAKNLDTEFMDVHIVVELTLKRFVEKWLALDFGTSAIAVAIFDPNFPKEKQVEVLNLNKIHTQKLKKDLKEVEAAGIEFDEQSTDFLSSLMYLNTLGQPNDDKTQDLASDIINFSPDTTEKRKSTFVNKVLPNLKMLMGHDYVPMANTNFFRVKSDDQKIEKIYEKLPVEVVFRAAYQKLFKEYIIPAIKDFYSSRKGGGRFAAHELLKTFGNIVVTVPNTFNQTHLKILKRLISKDITWDLLASDETDKELLIKIKELKKRNSGLFFDDCIKFIRESDAVACYYLKRWNKYHQSEAVTQAADKTASKDITEYLLIYDMGAGTIDISYQKIVKSDQDLKIYNLGKIGIIKAGNSLDTVITRILDVQSKLKNGQSKRNFFNNEQKNLANLLHLKGFVKDHFKLKLSEAWLRTNGNAKIDYETGKLEQLAIWSNRADFDKIVTIKLLKNNVLMEDYLNSITSTLIKKLCQIVNEDNFEDSKLKVDKVLISGRAAEFAPIKENLTTYFLKNTTIKSEKDILKADKDDLKTAVVYGAINRIQDFNESDIDPREINAYYGIIWKDQAFGGEDYKFKILLKPGFHPEASPENEITYDNLYQLYVLPTDNINMKFADKISLIKSFTPSPEDDYKQLRSDMVTKVLEIRKDALAIKNISQVPVQLKFDKNLMLRLRVQNVETNPTDINMFSLEQDLTYEENTWPFNQMINLEKEQDRLIEKIKNKEIDWEFIPEPVEKQEITPNPDIENQSRQDEKTEEKTLPAKKKDISTTKNPKEDKTKSKNQDFV